MFAFLILLAIFAAGFAASHGIPNFARECADAGRSGVLYRRLIFRPELGQETVLGSDPADQVRPVFLERVSVIKLDPGA